MEQQYKWEKFVKPEIRRLVAARRQSAYEITEVIQSAREEATDGIEDLPDEVRDDVRQVRWRSRIIHRRPRTEGSAGGDTADK